MDRTTIIAGPAIVTYNAQTFYTAGDITAKPTIKRFDISNSMHGKVDERLDTVLWEISFTPVGAWAAGPIAVLWPYQTPVIYSSMLGATDKDLVIKTLAGRSLTFNAACVTAMPDLILSAVKTPIGEITFTAIGANNTEMSDSAKYLIDAAAAFADTSFDPAAIKTVPYSAAWGSTSPWDDIATEEGWTVSFDLGMEEIVTDSYGISDLRLTSVDAMAKCKPLGVTEAEIMTLLDIQGTGVQRGRSFLDNANDLVIDGGTNNPLVTIKSASPVEAGYVFGGGSALRHDELAFVAQRAFAVGVAGALFTVAVGT